MVSADSAAKSQLLFVIEKIDGEYTLCGCSRVDYLDCEYYMNQSWMPADLGEPKAVKTWLLAFLYMLLMGGCRKVKPVSAAVQTALQI